MSQKHKSDKSCDAGTNQLEQHYDMKLLREKSMLVDRELNQFIDAFFADKEELSRFLTAMIKIHADEYEESEDEQSAEEADVTQTLMTHLWTTLLYNRFIDVMKHSIDTHLRPIFYGYTPVELEEVCNRALQINCGEVISRITERIQDMDVSTFLKTMRKPLVG